MDVACVCSFMELQLCMQLYGVNDCSMHKYLYLVSTNT